MKLSEVWRKVSNRPEHGIVGPIRLDYTSGEQANPNRRLNNAMAANNEVRYRREMESLLQSVFGKDMIVSHDRPATVIDVVETWAHVGHYGESRFVAAALLFRFDIAISRPGIGKEVVAKKVFDAQPPGQIGVSGRYIGDVSSGFPRQEIENWLRSFSFRIED
jgi:hypothetical protein